MGWWNASTDGNSLQIEATGLLWGDGPADLMDVALDGIMKEFAESCERPPTLDEIIAGVKFSFATILEANQYLFTADDNGA